MFSAAQVFNNENSAKVSSVAFISHVFLAFYFLNVWTRTFIEVNVIASYPWIIHAKLILFRKLVHHGK